MANNPRSDDHQASHADALAALHGMQDAPSEGHERNSGDASPDPTNAPSSTGLVGMLAQGQLNQPGPDMGSPGRSGFHTAVPMGVPQPKTAGTKGPAAKRPGKFDTIGVAKEIIMPEAPQESAAGVAAGVRPPPLSNGPAWRAPARPARRIAKPPEWWKGAIPVMYTVSSLLILISFWAVGAVISMIAGFKSFPLLDFDAEDNAFTGGSKLMAGVMLLCLPVAISIGILAIVLGRKIQAYEAKMAGKLPAPQRPERTTALPPATSDDA